MQVARSQIFLTLITHTFRKPCMCGMSPSCAPKARRCLPEVHLHVRPSLCGWRSASGAEPSSLFCSSPSPATSGRRTRGERRTPACTNQSISYLILWLCIRFVVRLEYKYSRLVMSASKECELPAADSCGLAEGEEPDDDVVYTQKPSLLGKLRAIANKVLNVKTKFIWRCSISQNVYILQSATFDEIHD